MNIYFGTIAADKLWGPRRTQLIATCPDGSISVTMSTHSSVCYGPRYHRLNSDGHANCHQACRTWQTQWPNDPMPDALLGQAKTEPGGLQ